MSKSIEELKLDNETIEIITKHLISKMELPEFAPSGVPIEIVAKVTGKAATWIRTGIEQGWFPIGFAQKSESGKRTNYYISPKLLWEVTGYVWRGED